MQFHYSNDVITDRETCFSGVSSTATLLHAPLTTEIISISLVDCHDTVPPADSDELRRHAAANEFSTSPADRSSASIAGDPCIEIIAAVSVTGT